jgi:hypothetical protein
MHLSPFISISYVSRYKNPGKRTDKMLAKNTPVSFNGGVARGFRLHSTKGVVSETTDEKS